MTRTQPHTLTLTLLSLSGLSFALFPLLRPWGDKTGTDTDMLEAMSSTNWVAAHLVGAFAFIFLSLAVIGVRDMYRNAEGARPASLAVPLLWLGTGATLLFYGVETFGLHAVASHPTEGWVEQVAATREGTIQITLFGVGLLLIAVGTIALAHAVWRSESSHRWAGIPLAAMVALYLPQFFFPPATRITHGIFTGLAFFFLTITLSVGSGSEVPARKSASITNTRHRADTVDTD